MGDLGIGIIGANPDTGWAFTAHVPAIAATPGLHVSAVATTRSDTARKAADLLGGTAWFTDARELAASPAVDLVVVSVKVPAHRELITVALDHGKPVLSEWPLARTTAEAEFLTDRAASAGVAGFIGLQGRGDPVINQARDIITAGDLGELVAISARSSRTEGETIPQPFVYTLDIDSAAGNLEVHGGHLIDLLRYMVPSLSIVTGDTSLVRTSYRVAGTDERVDATSPDVLSATLTAGARAVGGVIAWDGDPAAGTEIVIAGTAGRLRLQTIDPEVERLRQPQMAPFTGTLTTEHGERPLRTVHSDLPVAAQNVAVLYQQIGSDLRDKTSTAPTFQEALALHRTLDRLR